ncbi:hypothetical protein FRACYDRAFT_234829 [Fragilariopsis cylindrus CCMP1102]|uniref:Uncharacterized protein n=1 Tax=Fragilariopsis cylindrus CCMP1102 TaxID=635003 RepID=A0A1E7FTQ7_9STRA|nr:hypothetical protein FRACYDRAFT_234829 [Fragilariopsis cylindrus CCMP1102]|eukprot:OEU21203.1 hypothetical protein FRACYDRAFT_234829 [Fragilariopsis cylindrus CCMP1102]
MEAAFNSLSCCFVDDNPADDIECNRDYLQDRKHRRGRSRTFRINVNASCESFDSSRTQKFTESLNTLNQELEIACHVNTTNKEKGKDFIGLKNEEENVNTHKRKSRRRHRPREQKSKTAKFVKVQNKQAHYNQKEIDRGTADNILLYSDNSNIETLQRVGDSERETQLIIRNESIDIRDCSSTLFSSPSWNERETRRRNRQSMGKKIMSMRFKSKVYSSISVSTDSTHCIGSVDSVVSREEFQREDNNGARRMESSKSRRMKQSTSASKFFKRFGSISRKKHVSYASGGS